MNLAIREHVSSQNKTIHDGKKKRRRRREQERERKRDSTSRWQHYTEGRSGRRPLSWAINCSVLFFSPHPSGYFLSRLSRNVGRRACIDGRRRVPLFVSSTLRRYNEEQHNKHLCAYRCVRACVYARRSASCFHDNPMRARESSRSIRLYTYQWNRKPR